MTDSDSIEIDNIMYHIEDEELNDISYYEILSMEEIIKDNPTFIAFSKEEIFDELYDFFKNSLKADSLTELFYKNNKQNIKNIIFVSNAIKKGSSDTINKDSECGTEDAIEFVKTIEKINKQQYKTSQSEKEKIFFALTYDNNDNHIRLKPYMKTTIAIKDKNLNLFYPIYETDDTNIPVIAAYYNLPSAIESDYLSDKVVSYLKKPISFNYLESDGFKDIKKLLEIVKPKIDTILSKFEIDKEDFLLDYNHLNALLEKFDTSLEEINIEDFNKLKIHLDDILKIKPDKINYSKYKIKSHTIVNKKLEFFDKIHRIKNLLQFSDKTKTDYEILINKLQDEKIELNLTPLMYNNINDIVNALLNNDVDIDIILNNLSINKQFLIIDNAINTLKNITKNDIENISKMLDELTYKFSQIKGLLKDIFEFHFINFYHDLKEVKEANDFSDYDGIPDIYRNDGNYEGSGTIGETDEIDNNIEFDLADTKISNISLEKYWLSIKYNNSNGFIEILKIVLPILNKIQDRAKLNLNLDLLCDVLYNKFMGIPTKYNIMYDILKKNEINISDQYIKDIIKINPHIAVDKNNNIEDDMTQYVYECNKLFIDILFSVINYSLAWWSLQIQEDILNNTLIFDENLCDIMYIDKWSLDGLPVKESKQGVLIYLASILEDVMIENKIYTVPKNISSNVMKIINENFKEIITKLNEGFKNFKKRQNKGTETYTQLLETIKLRKQDKYLEDYIDALMYMPSYKFKKIHKFLLGCCLQKIGKDFTIDSDLIEMNRKDLLAIKKNYAKHRETNKPRTILYAPKKDELEEIEEQDGQEDFEKTIIEEVSEELDTVEEWLNKMRDTSSLLPNEFIDIFKNGTKEASIYSKKYIQIFCKTAGGKANEFEELFQKCNNPYNILKIICVTFKKYIYENDEEKILLETAINSIHIIINNIKKLQLLITEYNKQDIDRIKEFITTRALCLPCNPEIAINNILQASIAVSSNFIHQLSKTLYSTLIKYFQTIKMPTPEENIAMINAIREENKNKTLSAMNKKSQDDRNLMNQLKKIGVGYMGMLDEEQQPINADKEPEDDIQEGEKEFKKQDEEDYDDDTLDDDNYGFIYS